MSALAIPLAIGAAAAWAVGMTAAKPGIRHLDSLTFVLARWGIVSATAVLLGAVRGTLSFPSLQGVGYAAVAGLVDGAAGWVVFLMAMRRTSTHQTTTLSSTAPLWGVFGSVLMLGEALRWHAATAAGLVVVGSYFLVGGRGLKLRGELGGALFALLTGVLWGVAETVPSKLAMEHGLTAESFLVVFACSAVLGIACVTPTLRQRIPRHIERRGFLWVAVSAVGGSVVGWILWLRSLTLAPASLVSPVRGSTLLFAFLYAVVLLRERPAPRAVVGAALVLGGVLLVSFAG